MVIIIYTISTRIKQVLQVVQIRRLGEFITAIQHGQTKEKVHALSGLKL